MEVNLGPDLTSHHGWEVELKVHKAMLQRVARWAEGRQSADTDPHGPSRIEAERAALLGPDAFEELPMAGGRGIPESWQC